MTLRWKSVRGSVAALAATSLLAACQPNPQTASVIAAPKTPASKVLTSFTPALRCMDETLLAFGKRDIVMTTAGIPDSTGKVAAGTKEMLITAISNMSKKSKAITYTDYDTERNDLTWLFNEVRNANADRRKIPNFYIRGAITQLDDNALESQQSVGLAFSFADLGLSRDQVVSVLSVDMNMGDSVTRTIIPGVNASNSMAIVRSGRSGEAGGKIGKMGVNFSMSLNQSEGSGAATRALIELGLIELIGKLTNVPYWRCLEIDKTNPVMLQQARDWYDGLEEPDRIKFVQRKLAAAGFYSGAASGQTDRALTDAISRYKDQHQLIANGRIDFDLYYSLLDDQSMVSDHDSVAAPVHAPARSTPPLALTLNSNRGQRNVVFRPGESLKAIAELNQDAFLYCYYKDYSNQVVRIYPNTFQPNPYVRGNQMLPIGGDKFEIRFDRAGTREQIQCFASERDVALPDTLKAEDLRPIRGANGDDIAQAFRRSNPQVVESKLDIVIQ